MSSLFKPSSMQTFNSPSLGTDKAARRFGLVLGAAIVLALAVVIETTMLIGYWSKSSVDKEMNSKDQEVETEQAVEPDYSYDENGALTAISFTCRSAQKVYKFNSVNEVMIFDGNEQWQNSGEYSFVDKDTIRIFTEEGEPQIVLGFKDGVLSDNTNTYTCKSNGTNEEKTEE